MMDGRVKTLHPAVHGGILARRDLAAHTEAMTAHGIGAIDLVVVDLYPFAATVARGGSRDDIIENIDIGGPAMIRSAAKNHDFVAVVTSPGAICRADRRARCDRWRDRRSPPAGGCRAAFAATAAYDAMIASWFSRVDQGETFPPSGRCRRGW